MPTLAVSDKQAIKFAEEKKTTESWNTASKINALCSGL
jgi:DNA-binding XRE family transcriptional regulator